ETPNLPPAGEISWGWENLVAHDLKGDWWIPTARGLFRFSGNRSFSARAAATPRVYTTGGGMSGNEVVHLFVYARGDLWFSILSIAFSNLHRLDRAADTIHIFNSQDNDIPATAATAFANDWAGNLWLGFYNGGVCRYAGGRFKQFTEKDGLPPGRVRGLLFDARKRLWIAKACGPARAGDPLSGRPPILSHTTSD